MAEKKRKLLGKNSSLTVGTAVATALAAVTTSIVSTQLNGVLNSLALAAIISIVSALAGELYRNLIANTTEKTKEILGEHLEIVVPFEKTTGREGAADTATGARTVTSQSDLIEQPIDVTAELTEEITKETAEDDLGAGEETGEDRSGERGNLWSRFKRYLSKNRYMQYVLMFSGIVVLTSLINLWMFPDSANTYYFNTREVQAEMTETDTQAILDTLRSEIKSGALSTGQNTDAQVDGQNAPGASDETGSEPVESLTEWQTKLDELTQENRALRDQVAHLQTLLDELSARLNEMEQTDVQPPAGTSTPENAEAAE